MRLKQVIVLVYALCLGVLPAIAQKTDPWKNYIDSKNEIWFQAPESVLIDRNSEYESVTLHAFFNGVYVTVTSRPVKGDPKQYVKKLDLPNGEKGSKVREFKSDSFVIRQETEPVGKDVYITFYVGSKKSFFNINVLSSPENDDMKLFVDTLRFGGSRLSAVSAAQDIPINDNPIVFDKLPISAETKTALDKKSASSNPLDTFGIIRTWLPLSLDTLSRDVIILRKPRPGYTDSARERNVQGSIPVNVQFLANGEIGKLLVDQRLDISLARNVMTAARKIKFIPAQANGRPVDLTRTILYKFSIY